MARIGASEVKFSLQVSLGNLGIKQGHFRSGVAEQFHESGKAHTRSQHLSGKSVAKLMWDDGCGDAGCRPHVNQRGAEFYQEHGSIVAARQQPTVRLDRVQ